MVDCEHDWERCTTQPLDAPHAWFQCTKCKAIGYTRFPWHRRKVKRAPKVQPYVCSHEGCKDLAVQRIKGRSAHGAFIWACGAHQKEVDEWARRFR